MTTLQSWLRTTIIDPALHILGYGVGFVSVLVAGTATVRALVQASNIALPNEIPDPGSLTEMYRRGYIDGGTASSLMLRHGYDADTTKSLLALSQNLLSVPDLLNLRYKGVISDAAYASYAAQLGVSAEQSAQYLKVFEQRLDVLTVMSAWRRGFFTEGGQPDYFQDLAAQGWTPDRIDLLKKATSFIPPPTDVIRFLMRDVFIPEFVTTYGMAQEYPTDADAYFAKIGIDHDTALLYWEAHWELPSISQGYELYQRGQIKEDDLRRLLRAQGVEPYWRDPLIAISYNPITRVDIRRLHLYGTVKTEDLPGLYKQIGYSPANAQLLADFTVTYNAAHPASDTVAAAKVPAQYHGITESVVVDSYIEGILSKDEATAYLADINIPGPVASFILAHADYKVHQQELKDEIEIIKDSYLAGQGTLQQALSALGGLGLDDAAQAKAIAGIMRARRAQKSLPTKAELLKLYGAKVITARQYVNELRNLGYADTYIGWYLQEGGMSADEAAQTLTLEQEFGTLTAYEPPAQ